MENQTSNTSSHQTLRFDLDLDANGVETAARPRNLENPSVKCYRNSLYVLLFNTPVLLNYIDDHHVPYCTALSCQICEFRELARRFFAPDRERVKDMIFDLDVDNFWQMAMDGVWNWSGQQDPVEYMDRLFTYFEKRGVHWMRQLIYPIPKTLTLCHDCERVSKEIAPLPNISVSQNGTNTDLEDQLLKRYPPNQTDQTRCNECDRRTWHTMSEPIERTPPILPIQIQPVVDYIKSAIFPGSLKRLDQLMAFSSYPDPVDRPHTVKYTFYRLYGVIMHTGVNPAGGHYICAVERPNVGWLLFNDQDYSPSGASPQSKPTSLQEIEQMQRGDWRVAVLVYARLFEMDGEVRLRCEETNGGENNNENNANSRGQKRASESPSPPRSKRRRTQKEK